jgi:thiol-disulfide isomerase/thioredoxin
MKRLIALLLPLSFLVIPFTGCDEVDPPYKNIVADTTDVSLLSKKVLLEDFTGHKCGFCPGATRAAYDLKAVYGDRLIILAVHAGFFATTNVPPFTYDFKCPESIQLDDDFGVSTDGNPNGVINRRSSSGNYIVDPLDWGTVISGILDPNPTTSVTVEIENSYNSSTRELETTVNTEFLESLSGTHNLTVYIVEDSIINWQRDYDATPNDNPVYVHREVFRGSFNGAYGTALPSSNTGDTKSSVFTTTLNSAWNDAHMSVVAFVSNAATKEIIQVNQEEIE